jgi:hypothetical protein
MTSSTATFPVVSEIYSTFEACLQAQAKRLVEDIAAYQKTDFKSLWAKVKPQIRVGLLDIDLDDTAPIYCSHPSGSSEGAIRQRCRQPCLLGFSACPRHAYEPPSSNTSSSTGLEKVDRILDYAGTSYFVDAHGIARDKNGRPKGVVLEEVLHLFEKTEERSEE